MCFPKSFHFAACLMVGQSSYLMVPSLCDCCMTSQIHLLYTEGGEVHHWLELETRTLREQAGKSLVFVRNSVVILLPMPTHCAVVTPQEGPACKLLSNLGENIQNKTYR